MADPRPTLGFLLRETARLMGRRFDGFVEGSGISQAQWIALAQVSRAEGLTQAELAGRLGQEPISTCRMVDRLEAAGLLERRPDPADRRVRRLHLTDAARPALDRMREVAAGVYAEMLEGFAPGEAETLLALLDKVRANLSAALPDAASAPAEPPAAVPRAGAAPKESERHG